MRIVSRPPSERAAAAMAPLSVLPVFLDLQGRKAIVAGGSDAAAWKAELLAAAGAEVHAYAPEAACGARFRELRGAAGIIRHDAAWSPEILAGAAIAVTDLETEEEALAFHAACRAACVPANVIDRPGFCDVQFGSIVNRSPVVIGISTTGAAPVLAQAIRRRIETLLPPTLAAWAGLARRLREGLNARLAPGPQRRAFWGAFAERAFGPAPDGNAEASLVASLSRHAPAKGRVTLVGAGPGDAELLTLKAVRALQAADVILFDDLVSDEVLELARREARRILVGKRGGRPSCRQEEINAMMVGLARQGRHVVRLKSGDPMIFGRAGEEIAQLAQEGIPVEIIPGITAGIALAAQLGVSLTHRDCARSVRFITGHAHSGGLPEDIDWQAAADPAATTIFYMAAGTAGLIAARLLACGMAPGTPLVVAASLTRPEQSVRRGTLAELGGIAAAEQGRGPVIIGVGRVFAERRALHGHGEPQPVDKPAGRRMLAG